MQSEKALTEKFGQRLCNAGCRSQSRRGNPVNSFICEDDWGNFWVAEMPEEFVTVGEDMEIDGLIPFEDIPADQQVRIQSELDALPEDYLDVLRNYAGGED